MAFFLGGWLLPAAGTLFNMEDLIAEYEKQRRLAHQLNVQANIVDARLVEIEWQLPDDYPGNTPLDGDLPGP